MSDPTWLSYAGAATGIVGALTGTAGAIMGYIGYRRSVQLKSLDLRLELRKAVSDLFDEIQALPSLLEYSNKSRMAVAAATGRLQSGSSEQWLRQLEADHLTLDALDQGLSELNTDHNASTPAELETKLVEAHALKSKASRLREKYVAGLAGDDRARDHIREDAHVRTQANLQRKP